MVYRGRLVPVREVLSQVRLLAAVSGIIGAPLTGIGYLGMYPDILPGFHGALFLLGVLIMFQAAFLCLGYLGYQLSTFWCRERPMDEDSR